jgi:hypothetical protein
MSIRKSVMSFLSLSVCLLAITSSIHAATPADSARNISTKLMAERNSQQVAAKLLKDAGVKPGTWLRIGPFRDQGPHINWMTNVEASYKTVYDVEKDALANGGLPKLANKYPAPNFPATPKAIRTWAKPTGWIDGYYQQLPRAAAPAAGETQYVYRTITATKPVTIEIDCIIRAPEADRRMGSYGMEDWRRTGRYTWWVNGEKIQFWGGKERRGDMPHKAKVQLKQGKNHFLAKFTNNRHYYGFAFSIYGMHPNLRHERGFEGLWRPLQINKSTDRPYYTEKADSPAWFVKKSTWLGSLTASWDKHVKARGDAKGFTPVWSALDATFKSPKDRREIALAQLLAGKENRNFFNTKKKVAIEALIASRILAHASLPRTPNQTPQKAIEQAAEIVAYKESLERLMDLKFHPEPMAGVEHAAIDSRGRVVPAIEKALEKYPTSPAGDKHTARLAKMEKRVKSLLNQIATTGDPMVAQVLSETAALDKLWDQTIGELPDLLFLQRETYRYDSMMFTGVGRKAGSVRVFEPKSKRLRTLFDAPCPMHEIDLSWDAKTIFIGGGRQIHSIGVDGKNLKRLQQGQSPAQMPNGQLVFFDNEVGISPCKGGGPRQLLYTCDPDGQNRKAVSVNLTIDTSPSVMNDGRILFTRWDYGVNKNVFNRHALWFQNPDGTGMDLFFGNTVIDPRSMGRARQIPGRPEVLTVFGPHHANLTGLVGMVWNGQGKEAADGIGFRRVTTDTASVGDRPPGYAYQDIQPLNEQLFLVSYGGRPDRKVGLYLLDRSGNKKLIVDTAGTQGIHASQVFAPQPKPPVIPTRCQNPNWVANVDLFSAMLKDPDWTQKATLMMHDVYQGIEPEVKRGRAKYLAVMEQVIQSSPRGGSMGVGTIWYANRCIGLVPIEPDGSANFEVPAMRSLYLHVLDKEGKMLMTQGSDFHVMPGESRSCIGCHEQRKGSGAPPTLRRAALAFRKAPVRPKMPQWGTNGIIEYEAVVQPVLDKYCIKCHKGAKPKGNLNLTGDRTTVYSMSYMELVDRMLVHYQPGTGRTHAQPTNDCDEQAPLSRGTLLSKVTKYIQDPKHCKKTIPFEDQLAIFLWIDSNVPFYGHCKQKSPTILENKARGVLAGVHKKRCASCHHNDFSDTKSGLSAAHAAVHAGGEPGQWGIARSGMRVRHLNLSNAAHSGALQAPLAKSAGGWGLCKGKDNKPVFADTKDADYIKMLSAIQQVQHRVYPGVKQLLAAKPATISKAAEETKK